MNSPVYCLYFSLFYFVFAELELRELRAEAARDGTLKSVLCYFEAGGGVL